MPTSVWKRAKEPTKTHSLHNINDWQFKADRIKKRKSPIVISNPFPYSLNIIDCIAYLTTLMALFPTFTIYIPAVCKSYTPTVGRVLSVNRRLPLIAYTVTVS